jgi:nicotinamide-nucleotide amidase
LYRRKNIAQLLTVGAELILGGIVSYATTAKIDVLGVSERLINEHSVVSREVVSAMALNVKR